MPGYQAFEQTLTIEGGKTQNISRELAVAGLSEAELASQQRGLSSFGARTLPRGRSTVDVSVGGEVVATLGPGASFGEVALVDKSARSATVTATSTVRAYGLPVWSFRSFAEARPVVLWKLLELLAERLRAAEHR